MKHILLTSSVLALALSTSAPLFAAPKSEMKQTPKETCEALAAKEHVSKHKMNAYLKSCVEKHTAKTHGATK